MSVMIDFMFLSLVVVALMIIGATTAPVITSKEPTKNVNSIEYHVNYMKRFGHWKGKALYYEKDADSDEFIQSVKSLQHFGGIPVTGKVDDATKQLMLTPRCGLPDLQPVSTNRSKRFVLFGTKWSKSSITYWFLNYTSKMPQTTTRQDILDAIKLWTNVTPLIATEASSSLAANVNILFARRDHGDGDPFDGLGGILAHTFFPTDGRLHFDEDEIWTHGVSSGTNLFEVATHEFGHALGLQHSNSTGAVMTPYYTGYSPLFGLTQDDIVGVQAIYGKPKSQPAASATLLPTTAQKITQPPTTSPLTSCSWWMYLFGWC